MRCGRERRASACLAWGTFAAGVTLLAVGFASSACELAVHLDVGLVDGGTSSCSICLGDAEVVVVGPDGDFAIVPADAASDFASLSDGSSSSDGDP